MSARDKVENYKGKAKETFGRLTANRRLKSEGKTDQATSSASKGAEHAADTVRGVGKSMKDKLTGK